MNPRYAFLAACMMHVEGYYSTKSLAFRNKNPGNLEVIGHPGLFRVFDEPIEGFEALVNDIAANQGKRLIDFIMKFSPPSENDSQMYVQTVCTLSGFHPSDTL
jgi:hypothetical protein